VTGYTAALALDDGATGRRRGNVGKLLALARQQPEASLPRFLARLRDLQTREAREGEALGHEPESGAVQLMSIHAAKGLEFQVVVVADLGRQPRSGFGIPHLLHDPGYGLACRIRDDQGDWQSPAGYAWAQWQDEQMEAAERKRLLYVAATRTADLLLLTGRLGERKSWLAEILAAFDLEPDGPAEETVDCGTFALRVHRPMDVPPFIRLEQPTMAMPATFTAIPPLAQPFPPRREPRPIAVTHLEELLNQDPDALPVLRPALWAAERLGVQNLTKRPRPPCRSALHARYPDWPAVRGH